MTSFANSVITAMLGWVQALAASLWSFFRDGDGGSWLTWLGSHWILLAAALLAISVIVDLLIYLIRWRPYRVWGTFFRHLTGRHERLPQEDHNRPKKTHVPKEKIRRWVYADGSSREEIIAHHPPEEEKAPEPENTPRRRRSQQVEPISEAVAALEQSDPPRRRRSQQSEIEPAARRSRLHRLLNDDAENSYTYVASPTAGSREEKFHEPYYPPQYRRPGSEDKPND